MLAKWQLVHNDKKMLLITKLLYLNSIPVLVNHHSGRDLLGIFLLLCLLVSRKTRFSHFKDYNLHLLSEPLYLLSSSKVTTDTQASCINRIEKVLRHIATLLNEQVPGQACQDSILLPKIRYSSRFLFHLNLLLFSFNTYNTHQVLYKMNTEPRNTTTGQNKKGLISKTFIILGLQKLLHKNTHLQAI